MKMARALSGGLAGLLGVLVLAGCDAITGVADLQLEANVLVPEVRITEPAFVGVEGRNLGNARADWGRGSSTCQFYLLVRTDAGDLVAPRRECTSDHTRHVLRPGERRGEGIEWDGRVRFDGAFTRLPAGTYEVRAAAGDLAVSGPVTIEVIDAD
jgi:hypothetical protein